MVKYSLNGLWTMTGPAGDSTEGSIPGSVYSFLLDAGKMEDPYWADNELKALELMKEDYSFQRQFSVDSALLSKKHQVLRFDGIDTLSDVFLNGKLLGSTDNMHLYWEFDVTGLLKEKDNELSLTIKSPTKYIAEKDKEYHLGGSTDAMKGFPHLRKAHCMFGWDWGPRLPDMGIWKDVSLLSWDSSRIEDIRISQRHLLPDGRPAMASEEHCAAAREGLIQVELKVEVFQTGCLPVMIQLEAPDGQSFKLENGKSFLIPQPELWWPGELGEHPLYRLSVMLCEDSSCCGAAEKNACGAPAPTDSTAVCVEKVIKRIGLRTVRMKRQKDEWGESFAAEVNGRSFFSMGADYIPEDCILSRLNKDRTRALLEDCVSAHFNVIRVWGGGFYPFDYFYDLCDEMGLLVWQDFMFACANYRLTDDFVSSIREEVKQNVRRLRHHPSLGLWCGNNEMEQFALMKVYDGDDITSADYLIQNEFIIPEVLKKEDPAGFYWPSSPSSGGKYIEPWDPNRGDVHYWAVWHEGVPFTAYRSYHFRYLSEFGFQSFPCLETVRSFAPEEEQNIFSYVMEMHQRNSGANGKIMQYLSATYRYPGDFETLLYASQLLQAEAIRYGVEHFRRNRNNDRCMGAVYWQLNDNWPVASWASRDYFGRWKALHYYAARFFSPILLSCEEDSVVSQGKTCISEPGPQLSTARLSVSNESWDVLEDEVIWELRDPRSNILESGNVQVKVEPFSSLWLDTKDFSSYDYRSIHLTYRLLQHGSAGSVLFAPPKHYRFEDPTLSIRYDSESRELCVKADCYAKSVEIYSDEGYIRLSDNYFDMEAGEVILKLLEGDGKELKVRSVYDIR